jgi:hypothetical protein
MGRVLESLPHLPRDVLDGLHNWHNLPEYVRRAVEALFALREE